WRARRHSTPRFAFAKVRALESSLGSKNMETRLLGKTIAILLFTFCIAMANNPRIASADSTKSPTPARIEMENAVKDFHSYANPADVRLKHLDLAWDVLFDKKILKGTAVLTIARVCSDLHAPLMLDTRHLNIEQIETSL